MISVPMTNSDGEVSALLLDERSAQVLARVLDAAIEAHSLAGV